MGRNMLHLQLGITSRELMAWLETKGGKAGGLARPMVMGYFRRGYRYIHTDICAYVCRYVHSYLPEVHTGTHHVYRQQGVMGRELWILFLSWVLCQTWLDMATTCNETRDMYEGGSGRTDVHMAIGGR